MPLDPSAIFDLAQLGLSNRRVAIQLGCDPKTLGRFAASLARARMRRQTLWQLAEMQRVEENDWAALQRQLQKEAKLARVKRIGGNSEEKKKF